MMSPRTLRRTRIVGAAVGLGAGLLHVACLPFYSGGPLGSAGRWRLEHGRLTVRRDDFSPSRESFYVAPNAEGLRWSPEGRFDGWGAWSVTVPLWMVWGPCLVFALAPMVRRRSAPGGEAA